MRNSYTVGEFKARFPEALDAVRRGETVAITYGRARRTVAVLAPPKQSSNPRKLGRHEGKIRARIADDWKMDEETFLGS